MTIRIFTDSAAGIQIETLKKYQIETVELTIIWDKNLDQEVDHPTDDLSKFYNRLTNEIATTAHPEPERFKVAFREWLEVDDLNEIICITISKLLSNTYYSAVLAAQAIDPDGSKITVIDSGIAAMGEGWQVIEAARAVTLGKTRLEICDKVYAIREKALVLFKVGDISALVRGGRIPDVVLAVQNRIGLIPIVVMTNGSKARLGAVVLNNRQALKKIAKLAKNNFGDNVSLRASVNYTDCFEEAKKLLEELGENLHLVESIIQQPPRVIGVHTGPKGVTGVCLVPASD